MTAICDCGKEYMQFPSKRNSSVVIEQNMKCEIFPESTICIVSELMFDYNINRQIRTEEH